MHSSHFILSHSLIYCSKPETMNPSQHTSGPGSSIPHHASSGPPLQFQPTELSLDWVYTLIS